MSPSSELAWARNVVRTQRRPGRTRTRTRRPVEPAWVDSSFQNRAFLRQGGAPVRHLGAPQHLPHLARQHVRGERLLQENDPRLADPVAPNGIVGGTPEG